MADESAEVDERSEITLSDAEERMGTEGDNEEANQGWADAMARILLKELPENKDMWDTCVSKRHGIHKGGTGRTGGGIKAIISYLLTGMPEPPVLVKYKKIEKRKTERKEEIASKKLKSQERHAMLEKDHVKPDGSTMDYEKNLVKIATRGVVKLFNAVSKHQKEMESKLKSAPTEAKKSKVVESMSKSAFLDMLKSSSDKARIRETNEKQKYKTNDGTTTDNSSSWNILRDDFMMGAKMKDWNREEQQTKRKDKKVTNITDYELETSHADFFDESDEGDNEELESSSDEG